MLNLLQEQVVAICPSVERRDLVCQLVQSWQEVTPEPRPQLLVLAMGKDDGTVGWCQNQGIAVFQRPEPLPFASACNVAANFALGAVPTAQWLLLLNNDLVLQPDFWPALQQMTTVGYEIIGAKLLYPPGHQHGGTIQHYGKMFTLDYYPFHVLRFQPADHDMAKAPRPFPVVSFACAAIRRNIWEGLGGLCEDYQNGYEDDDFCLAAREQGAQIGVHQLVMAHHYESQTSGMDSANKEAQWLKFKAKWVDSGRIQWPLGVFQGWRAA